MESVSLELIVPIIDFRLQRANRRYTCFNMLMSYFFTIGISLLVIYPVNCIAQESTPDISAGINSKRQNYLSKVVSFRFSNCFIETDRAIISCQFRTKCVQVPPAPTTDATSVIPPTGLSTKRNVGKYNIVPLRSINFL